MAFAALASLTKRYVFQTSGILTSVVISCLLGIGWLIFINMQVTALASRAQQNSIEVMAKFRDLRSELRQIQFDQHSYSLTGQPSTLAAFNAGVKSIKEKLTTLCQLTADIPLRQGRMYEISSLIAINLLVLETNVARHGTTGLSINDEQLNANESVKLTNQIRSQVDQAQEVEAQLLLSQSQKIKDKSQGTSLLIALGLVVGSLALILILWMRQWELRLRDKRYQSLLHSTDECFCVVDMIFNTSQQAINYHFLESNLAFKRLKGVSDDHHQRMLELLPDNTVHWYKIFGEVALSGKPQRFISNTKNSAQSWFNVYVFRLGGVDSVTIAIGFTDMTQSQLIHQKELGLKNITEVGVRQRNTELETANKELASFSYSVSHELKTPLNTLSGFSHLLETAIANNSLDKAAHYVSRIRRSVVQMSTSVDGLLSLTKLPQKILQTSTVNLSEISKKIMQDWCEQEPQRQVEISIQDDIQVRGDARLLPIVIGNLLGNAWKFSAKQKVSRIQMGSESDCNGQPVYFIRDNGAGFDMSHADRIFIAFERLHLASDFPGTGIGLATVKRIVKLHGGRVWAESKKDAGAVFYFTLEPQNP
ncbi:Phytochrome-like protein cph1 [Polaromonas vacuolata]|uniref:histidine kinase n=2 Tax=Polaromonas vacuolata TaxID=37448 RepID=A0A6H2HAZ2_9BURK|nr:Phytochrome-like protein cph1 [Polaromonas vacuolata]